MQTALQGLTPTTNDELWETIGRAIHPHDEQQGRTSRVYEGTLRRNRTTGIYVLDQGDSLRSVPQPWARARHARLGGVRGANNILVARTQIEEPGRLRERATTAGYAVHARYNYAPIGMAAGSVTVTDGLEDLPEWVIAVPSIEYHDPDARNQLGRLGAYCTRPDMPALVAAVEEMQRRIGHTVPVQYNGADATGIPADWSRQPLGDSDFERGVR